MTFFIYDSFSREKKKFEPINSNNIRIYACGPTVYSYAHIGNARMSVVTDLLVRVLKTIYNNVKFVSNITDNDYEFSMSLLKKSNGNVKIAIVRYFKKCSIEEAKSILNSANGSLSEII